MSRLATGSPLQRHWYAARWSGSASTPPLTCQAQRAARFLVKLPCDLGAQEAGRLATLSLQTGDLLQSGQVCDRQQPLRQFHQARVAEFRHYPADVNGCQTGEVGDVALQQREHIGVAGTNAMPGHLVYKP